MHEIGHTKTPLPEIEDNDELSGKYKCEKHAELYADALLPNAYMTYYTLQLAAKTDYDEIDASRYNPSHFTKIEEKRNRVVDGLKSLGGDIDE